MRMCFVFVSVLSLAGCIGWGEERLVGDRAESLDATAIDRLAIDVGAGSLDVEGDPALEAIQVDVWLRTHLISTKLDAAATEALAVTLEPSGDGAATLRVRVEELEERYYADVRVRVPARLALDVEDGSGEASIADVASLEVRDASGELTIARVRGATSVSDESGGIEIEDVGALSIRDDSGDLDVYGVLGDASIVDDSGEVALADVRGSVDIDDGSGGIRIERVEGAVTIDDGSGDIDASEVGSLDVRSDESGEVRQR